MGFHEAAQEGDVESVHVLAQHYHSDINSVDSQGRTPLHVAVQHAQKDVVQALCEHGVDVDQRDNQGYTALARAVSLRQEDIVAVLLEHKADCSIAVNSAQSAPLHIAASAGDVAILRRLAAAGADTGAKDKSGNTPLFVAASAGAADVVRALLNAGADANVANQWKVTALHEAVRKQHSSVVTELLSGGADVNARDDWGHMPLMEAAAGRSADIVQQLLNAGAQVDATQHTRATALHKAAASHCGAAIVDMLLAHCSDSDSPDCYGKSALLYAVESGNEAALRALLAVRADVERALPNSGATAVFAARSRAVLQLLIDAGADLTHRDAHGQTALHHTTCDDMARAMLTANAKLLSCCDAQGCTALHRAAQRGAINIVRLLLREFGADVNALDGSKRTALHLAAEHNHTAVVEELIMAGANTEARQSGRVWGTSGKTPRELARDAAVFDAAVHAGKRRRVMAQHDAVHTCTTAACPSEEPAESSGTATHSVHSSAVAS